MELKFNVLLQFSPFAKL